MGTVNVTFTLVLPEEVAAKAEQSGVLRAENLERWITEEVARQERLNEFSRIIAELRALEPPITQEEIDEEIRLYREERRQERLQQVHS